MTNGDIYEGRFNRGIKSGPGQLRSADGGVLTGTFKRDMINGTGDPTSKFQERQIHL